MEEAELELLRRTWCVIARSADLAEGAVLGVTLLGERLVAVRSAGRVTLAQGYCPHRGMALWLGALRDRNLECPYHGWLFDPGSGECVQVPSMGPDVRPAVGALRTYPVREAYGHIWASLEEPYLDFPVLPWQDEDGWEFSTGPGKDLDCGLRSLTENFRDISHFAFVHTGSMGPDVQEIVHPYSVVEDGWDLEWHMDTDLGGTALAANTAVASRISLTHHLRMPNVAYVQTAFPDGGRRFLAQFVTPLAADGQRTRLFWLLGIDATVRLKHGVDMAQMWDYEQRIFEEDYGVVENQWPRESPLDLHGQVHTRADRHSLAYRRAYQRLMDEFAVSRTAASNGHGAPR